MGMCIILQIITGICLSMHYISHITYSHIIRSIILQSYIYLFNTWITGIILYLMLIVIAFLGYVLPWGQMSYWSATVITNVLSFIPDIVEWICGSFFVYNPTLSRFFVLHFILPFLVMCLLYFIFFIYIY